MKIFEFRKAAMEGGKKLILTVWDKINNKFVLFYF